MEDKFILNEDENSELNQAFNRVKDLREKILGKQEDPAVEDAKPSPAEKSSEPAADSVKSAPPEPDEKPAPIAAADISALEKQLSELKKELSRRSGEYGSQLEKLRKELQASTDRNDSLSRELEGMKTKMESAENPEAEDPPEVKRARIIAGMPKELRANLQEEFIDAAAQIAENVYNQKKSKLVPAAPAPAPADDPVLRRELEAMKAAAATSSFIDVVDHMAPGFKEANGNVSLNIPANVEWSNFLDSSKDQFETWRTFCTRIGSPEAAAFAYNAYSSRVPEVPQPSSRLPSVEAQVSPKKAQAAKPADGAAAKVYSRSDYEKFKLQVASGEIPPEKAQVIFDEYKMAFLSGRIK